ncbi:Linoleate 11-lipoxygenase [Cytospora mali]|uniref:Manganese lipoxygenase n=1 Tax=Cytospora mali TaxID=578113 RepID=A0A194VP65_CYTMA|nr:Linoleate 11-lipoxygenase [Valsa mali]
MHYSQLLLGVVALLASQGLPGEAIAVPKAKRNTSTVGEYTLPQDSSDPIARAAALAVTQAGFTYGPPVAGGPYYPSGVLGTAKAAADLAALQEDLTAEEVLTGEDSSLATVGSLAGKYDGLKTLEDYTLIYDGEWTHTLPKGPTPGVLTNFTQDLLFSMERLSTSPYAIRRLNPSSDSLAFEVDNSIVNKVAGKTLRQLFEAGRLFYADYSDQAGLARTSAYAAACDAYFFIDEESGDFLPLAIRTGVGSNLIYTPEDDQDDWLLAKMMYNVNDFWFAQWNHLAGTHEVVQIVWMAAIRTLSAEHPVFALLDRLMFQAFAIQPLAASVLFVPGGAVDEVFAYTGTAAQDYATARYTGSSGAFQANYFLTDLERRGLINSSVGPELSHFPFYEDGSTIYNAIRRFMTSFIASYYHSDAHVRADAELQAWAKEANGAAEAIDFPSKISSTETIIDILTHMAHLASTAHHTVNTNELLSISSTLPFHPPALYSPIPTTKGLGSSSNSSSSVVDFLPPFDKVVTQLTFAGLFARPLLVDTDRSLLHMFDDEDMLARMNGETQAAAAKFKGTMQAFSDEVGARAFDGEGLSQGMPFVWQALDPKVAPYSITT